MASLGVVQMLKRENAKLGIPEENIIPVQETREAFADVQWNVLGKIESNKDLRLQVMQGPLVSHAIAYLSTKGYTDEEINKANIVYPDALVQDEEPDTFNSGALGDFYYFFEIAIRMNDYMRKEIAGKQQAKMEAEEKKINSGARMYFLSWVFGAGADLSNNPMFQIPIAPVLANEFNFPLENHYSLSKADWNPPFFGELERDELNAGKSEAARRYRAQLKDALAGYLLKAGYTQSEIDNNYKLVGFSGRGGGALMVAFEMNYKTLPKEQSVSDEDESGTVETRGKGKELFDKKNKPAEDVSLDPVAQKAVDTFVQGFTTVKENMDSADVGLVMDIVEKKCSLKNRKEAAAVLAVAAMEADDADTEIMWRPIFVPARALAMARVYDLDYERCKELLEIGRTLDLDSLG